MSLLDMSAAGGGVILAVVVIRALGVHRLPGGVFTALWAVALARLLIPAAVPSAMSVYAWFPLAETMETAEAAETVPAETARTSGAPAAGAEAVPVPAAEAAAEKSSVHVPWDTVVWAFGALGCGGFFAMSYVLCRRRFREAVPVEDGFVRRWQEVHPLRRRVSVRLSGRVDAPMTYGLLRPVILLPSDLDWRDRKGLGFILAHEYGHIRRLDGLKKLILTAAVCLHWFNPLVWVMLILANRDMEMACDEQVVRAMETGARADYARTLIRMEEAKSGLAPLVSHFSANAMEERITSIMRFKKLTAWAVVLSMVLTLGVTAVFATSAPDPTAVPDSNTFDWLDWLGEDPLSFKVFYNGAPYQLPAPAADFAANGWVVTEGAGQTVAPGESCPVEMTLRQEAAEEEGLSLTLRTSVHNYSDEALPAEDCYVTCVEGGEDTTDLSIVIPAPGTGIAWGMPGKELTQALRGMDYALDEDGERCLYTLEDPAVGGSIVIRTTREDIHVTGIRMTCEPDGIAVPAEPAVAAEPETDLFPEEPALPEGAAAEEFPEEPAELEYDLLTEVPAVTPVPLPVEDLRPQYVWDLTGGSGVVYEEDPDGGDYLLDIQPYGYRAPVNFAYIKGGQSFNSLLQPGAGAIVGSSLETYEILVIVHSEGQLTMFQRSLDGGEENPVGGQTLDVKDGDIITGFCGWTGTGGTEFYIRNAGDTELKIDAFMYET